MTDSGTTPSLVSQKRGRTPEATHTLAHTTHDAEMPHLTLRDAARRLGVSTGTLRAWAHEGLIRAERSARGALRFHPEAIRTARSLLGFPESGD